MGGEFPECHEVVHARKRRKRFTAFGGGKVKRPTHPTACWWQSGSSPSAAVGRLRSVRYRAISQLVPRAGASGTPAGGLDITG